MSSFAQALEMRGQYFMEHYNKDGELLGIYEFHNDITDGGVNSLWNIMFHAATQITSWFFGLVDNSGWTAFPNADTMSSHTGWTEFTSYSESTRVQWSMDAASSRAITNGTTVATFTISGNGTLKGVFLTSNSTKSSTTGTLWSTAAFNTTIPVSTSDVLKLTYSLSA